MRVIVVNPEAKKLRKNRRIRRIVRDRFTRHAHIIDVQGADKVVHALDALSTRSQIDIIYVVGGDGTFNNVLNWIASIPSEKKPALISVGGGQFCYMTKFHDLPSKDPIKNLQLIFSNKIKLKWQNWKPICVHDSLTQKQRYAAVVAGGVVSDMLEWYESVGKGGFLKVIWLIILAALSVASDTIRLWHKRIKMTEGELILGATASRSKTFTGFAFSTIPMLLARCRPFRGIPNQYEFYAAGYWGGLRALALAAPFVWFGRMPFWIRSASFNNPIRSTTIKTTDPRLVMDGDVFRWPGTAEKNDQRTLTLTIGEIITLLVVDLH